MLGAVRIYQSCLRFISPAHAIVPVPALGGSSGGARTRGDRMGTAQQTFGLSDAAGRRAAHRVVARLPVMLGRLWTAESGATAVEYGLIVACMFLAIVGGMSLFASNENAMYTHVSTAIATATTH